MGNLISLLETQPPHLPRQSETSLSSQPGPWRGKEQLELLQECARMVAGVYLELSVRNVISFSLCQSYGVGSSVLPILQRKRGVSRVDRHLVL